MHSRSRLILSLLVALGSSACWLSQAASDRRSCDQALEKICGTTNGDCGGKAGATVDILRRCESDEIRGDRGYDLSVCIDDSSDYVAILAALEANDGTVCTLTCTQRNACDLEERCHEVQYSSCSPRSNDGGAPDAS